MSKFTPGTWIVDTDTEEASWCVKAPGGYVVAWVIDMPNHQMPPNARLIAAAPEMYELLAKYRVERDASGPPSPELVFFGWLDDVRALLDRIDGDDDVRGTA